MNINSQEKLADKATWVLESKTRFLMRNALSSILASLFVISTFTWAHIDTVTLSVSAQLWVVFGYSLGAVRIVHYLTYRKQRKWFTTQQWLDIYRALTFLSGVVYGLMTILFFNQSSAPLQVLTLFVVVGMSSAAAGTHAADQLTFRLFMFTIVIPSAIFLYFTGDPVFKLVAFMIFVFAFVMDRSAGQTTRSILENIEMTYTMSYRATHDPLVGLFNREELEHRFEIKAPQSHRAIAMMFVDLDDFKPLNDTLGHQAGDQALIDVAGIIKNAVRADDIAARLGGDEFVVILFLDNQQEAQTIAEQILKNIQAMPFSSDYQGLSCSVGISFYENAEVSFSRLMRFADMACYQSKESGKNTITTLQYTP